MSWRGVKKSLSRLPHQFKTRNGSDDVTQDTEFAALESRYKEIVSCAHELFIEANAYRDYLAGMLDKQWQCANDLTEIFCAPFMGSTAHARQLNDVSSELKQAVEDYATAMEYCREEITALLDEFDARVVRPADQFQLIVKTIDKTIIKRQHKLIDFDRHRVSYLKYSAIAEPSPSEEKNMFKLQTQYENAAHDYDYFNNLLKGDLAKFLDLSSEFIYPLVESFYDIQLRILGGIYGRIHEVIQHNQASLITWNMPIEEGYMFRLSQIDVAQEFENLDLLKKGSKSWEKRGSIASSYKQPLHQDDNNIPVQGYANHRSNSSSIYGNISTDTKNRSDSTYYDAKNSHSTSSEYGQSIPYGKPPPVYRKPSLSSNTSGSTQSVPNNSNNKPTPPPLAKKPLLSRYSSSTNAMKTPSPPPSIPRPSIPPVKSVTSSGSITNRNYVNDIKGNERQENEYTGYRKQTSKTPFSTTSSTTSSYNSTIMTPPAVIESPASSPFSDQQQVMTKKKRAPPPPPSRPSKNKIYVEALYDFNAHQDGDISFSVGDRIEIIEKSDKSDDWWKGRLGNNEIGMFPGNYVRQI